MTDNNIESKLGYSPKGSITPNPSLKIVMYVFAVLLLIAGIIVYFTVMPEILIIISFVFFAILSWFCGFAFSRSAWYWNEEKFSITQLSGNMKDYNFSDIEKIYSVTEGPAVTVMIRMKNGKENGISLNANGTKELIEQIQAFQEKNASLQ
mgnify:CR=1 FL=1